jgi:hypothetical protein
MNRNQKFEAVLHLVRLRVIDLLFFGNPEENDIKRWDETLNIGWAINLKNRLRSPTS